MTLQKHLLNQNQLTKLAISLEDNINDKLKKNYYLIKFGSFSKNISFSNDKVSRALIIGGSHIESAKVLNTNSGIKFVNFQSKNISKIKSEDDFFNLISDSLNFSDSSISISLALPLKQFQRLGRADGVLLSSPKEHNLKSLVGKKIGLEIENYFRLKFNKKIKVSVINNLNALALSSQKENSITGIISTGLNFGFFKNNNFINLELASFSDFQTNFGNYADKNSMNPGVNIFEKEVSAAYLHDHYNLLASLYNIDSKVYSIKDLINLQKKGNILEKEIVKIVFTRSAQIVAASIKAVLKTSKLKNKVKFFVEGDLFWKVKNYKEKVFENLKKLDTNLDIFNFLKVKFGFLKGAILVLVYKVKFYSRIEVLAKKIYQLLRIYIGLSNSPPINSL